MPTQTLLERVQEMRQAIAGEGFTLESAVTLLADVQTELQNTRITRALAAMSFSELLCLDYILDDLDEPTGGLLVASKIADREGVTRSVMVNAISKLAAAGIVESRSLGMKGTNIKFINGLSAPDVVDALRTNRKVRVA